MTEIRFGFGVIKWFGGYNKNTGRENNFGFLCDISGKDIYLHKNEIEDGVPPNAPDIYFYHIEEFNGRPQAIKSQRLNESNAGCAHMLLALTVLMGKDLDSNLRLLKKSLTNRFATKLLKANDEELLSIARIDDKNFSYEIIHDAFEFKNSSAEVANWEQCFELLTQNNNKNIFQEIEWSFIPPKIIKSKIYEISDQLNLTSKSKTRNLFIKNLNSLPIEFIFHLFIKNIFISRQDVQPRIGELENYIESHFNGLSASIPKQTKNAYAKELIPLGGFRASPVVWEIMEPHLFKQYLFDKNQSFINLYESSNNLKCNLQYFILFNIFSLIKSGNNIDTVYQIFTQSLWEAIVEGRLDLATNSKEIDNLFPSCGTLGKDLSCEAVFWEKGGSYLCRGSKCINPQILPDTQKHFTQYNIYDWFAHYEVNYTKERLPSKKDFPIKLAGYFNRLKEIYPIIHCRDCGELMLPDFRYARTKYKTYKDGAFVTVDMAAAYRLTVFHCNNTNCHQHKIGYYISHCIGFGCHKIIDTRDLTLQCDAGRYICDGCGSCCETHNKSNPVGLCSNCGNSLQLIESADKDYLGRNIRRVQCGASCGFTIPPKDLPKKFRLPTCQPVLRELASQEIESEFDIDF